MLSEHLVNRSIWLLVTIIGDQWTSIITTMEMPGHWPGNADSVTFSSWLNKLITFRSILLPTDSTESTVKVLLAELVDIAHKVGKRAVQHSVRGKQYQICHRCAFNYNSLPFWVILFILIADAEERSRESLTTIVNWGVLLYTRSKKSTTYRPNTNCYNSGWPMKKQFTHQLKRGIYVNWSLIYKIWRDDIFWYRILRTSWYSSFQHV